MKLHNFLIGLGIFALFTIIIFGFINNDGGDCKGIYCKNFLNVTHDSETNIAISNISTVGQQTDDDYSAIKEDVRGTNTTFETGLLIESSFFKAAWRVIKNIPNSYEPVSNVLRMSGEKFGVPIQFTTWALSAIVIIVGLMIITAFLRNKLQS